MMVRKCACCGALYNAASKSQKWCRPCRNTYGKHLPEKQKQSVCEVCGDWFIPVNRKQRYCSEECRRKEAAKAQAEKEKKKQEEKRKKQELKKIRTEWWIRYMKADNLTKDAMLARRFGFSSYGAMMTSIEEGKTNRVLLELTAMQQEREKYEKERESNGETV